MNPIVYALVGGVIVAAIVAFLGRNNDPEGDELADRAGSAGVEGVLYDNIPAGARFRREIRSRHRSPSGRYTGTERMVVQGIAGAPGRIFLEDPVVERVSSLTASQPAPRPAAPAGNQPGQSPGGGIWNIQINGGAAPVQPAGGNRPQNQPAPAGGGQQGRQQGRQQGAPPQNPAAPAGGNP